MVDDIVLRVDEVELSGVGELAEGGGEGLGGDSDGLGSDVCSDTIVGQVLRCGRGILGDGIACDDAGDGSGNRDSSHEFGAPRYSVGCACSDTGSDVTWMQREPNIELSLIEEWFVTIFLNPSGNIFRVSDTGGIVCLVIVV
jgi:hypothetical protein